MEDKPFVVGADGHVLSEKELEEAQRLDEPVSTGDAPDARKATTARIERDRDEQQIRKYEKLIAQYEAELPTIVDAGWRQATVTAIAEARGKAERLRRKIEHRLGKN